jgi:hypothetical protein
MQDEIIKHGNKIKESVQNKNHSFAEKIKEVVLEILIIVFAVSLSIWLHGKSEHSHQQDEVNDFLLDLKSDLKTDINNIKKSLNTIEKNRKDYKFLAEITPAKIDSMKVSQSTINFSSSILTTRINNANYDGFKSSGKIGYIENKELKKLILVYYQDYVISINEIEKLQIEDFDKALELVNENSQKSLSDVFLNPMLKQKFRKQTDYANGLVDVYQQSLKKANEIVKLINIEN